MLAMTSVDLRKDIDFAPVPNDWKTFLIVSNVFPGIGMLTFSTLCLDPSIGMLKGGMRWKGCIDLNCYSVGDSQPYMLAVGLCEDFSASLHPSRK